MHASSMSQKRDRKRATTVNTNQENDILKKNIINIFSNIQTNVNNHHSNLNSLKSIFKKLPFDEFLEQFMQCFFIVLNVGEKNAYIDLTLSFCAKFCNCLKSESSDDNSLNMFFVSVLNILLKNHNASSDDLRFRVCEFIGLLLSEMGESAVLDEDLFNLIVDAMLERIKDFKSQIRVQAVISLHRLQSLNDPTNPVMKAYIFHMEHDPSPQVRRAVINNIAFEKEYVSYVFNRIKDVDERVRRDAYRFLSKFRIDRLKISQRQNILSTGLKDRSLSVKKIVTQVLMPKWLLPYKQTFFKFMECIVLDGDENELKESINVLEIVSDFYFRNNNIEEVIELLQLNDKKVITSVKLETAIYWKCLACFLEKQNNEDLLESILPDLTCFCELIKKYIESQRKDLNMWEFTGYQYTLLTLLNMLNFFDTSDEVGRINLKKLIVDILMNEKLLSFVIEKLVLILSGCFFKENDFLEETMDLISNLIEPIQMEDVSVSEGDQMKLLAKSNELRVKLYDLMIEQENAVAAQDFETALKLKSKIQEIETERDNLKEKPVVQREVRKRVTEPYIICKILDIINSVFILPQTRKLHPCLRTVQKEFVSEYCTFYENPQIQKRSLQIVALCGYLDLNTAKTISKIFYAQIMAFKFGGVGTIDVVLAAISGIVDFLLVYGFEAFSIDNNNSRNETKSLKRTLYDESQADISGINLNGSSSEDNSSNSFKIPDLQISVSSNELIVTLTSFLEHEDLALRTKAAECFCKLFINGCIKSVSLLSRLIILWFNPATEPDVELRQILGVMLSFYAQQTIGSQELFAAAYLPTLKTLCEAPSTSPLFSVDLNVVIKYFVTHSLPGFNPFDDVNVHNYLAFQIFEELQKNPTEKHTVWLLKTLLMLNISKNDKTFQAELVTKADHLLEVFTNKVHIKMLNKVIDQINSDICIEPERTSTISDSQDVRENNEGIESSEVTDNNDIRESNDFAESNEVTENNGIKENNEHSKINEYTTEQNTITDLNIDQNTNSRKKIIITSETDSDIEMNKHACKRPCRRSKRLLRRKR